MEHLMTKYIKPSFFENKILPLLRFIYDDSKYNGTYDFYRIKDILDQYSSGQLRSKEWLVDQLKPWISEEKTIVVCGGWYGLMSHMLAEVKPKNIKDYEIDKQCIELHDKIKVHDCVSIHEGDGLEIFDSKKLNKQSTIFVCTACEHIDPEDLYVVLNMKHPEMIVALQSNNMYNIDSHINCHDSIENFIKSLPDMEMLYQGTLTIGDYDRYMVIAK